MTKVIWGEAPLSVVRERKRNSKKNRTKWARTAHLRARPITGGDFDELKKGKFNWVKG
jgi:hypothetical protein